MSSNNLCKTTRRCRYHLAFAPSNRAAGAYSMVKREMGEILQKLCYKLEVEVVLLETRSNYVYMQLNIPPWHCPPEIVRYLKGASSIELFRRYSDLANMLSGQVFWADGCLLNTQTSSKRIIQDYINKQLQTDWAAECSWAKDSVW